MVFKDFEAYKYVRLKSDELRFCESRNCGLSHKDLVKDGEVAISAGLILIRPENFTFIDRGSMTLSLFGSLDSDFPLLEKITGRKFEGRNF